MWLNKIPRSSRRITENTMNDAHTQGQKSYLVLRPAKVGLKAQVRVDYFTGWLWMGVRTTDGHQPNGGKCYHRSRGMREQTRLHLCAYIVPSICMNGGTSIYQQRGTERDSKASPSSRLQMASKYPKMRLTRSAVTARHLALEVSEE